MKAPTPPTRDRIINAAAKLFSMDGVRAVSLDAVAEKAGVTKRTLYYHFESKDDLIAAYLDGRDLPNQLLFKRWFRDMHGNISEKTQALFNNLAKSTGSRNWRGCGFLRTAAELANLPGHPALEAARLHKKKIEAWLAEEYASGNVSSCPQALARQIVLLMNGGFALVMLHRDPSYLETAGQAARALIETQLST
ncbi:TetR/AcrR family transcriptional regulator [Brucella sp. NBRC 12950]|uniref:TetR/AcrR family transcriptional regulator n=1 Tax=Brucella sp. NBRC 12950 TaxID=2994518 RepID=UPI00255586D9|nr:TetR/AcrR family transcriptional regulator [Brucella sp. NBRC 12950]